MSSLLAIRTDGLRRNFGSVEAVAGIDLEVSAGEVTAFLGPNGAGKTTTIRMLLGLIAPDSGTIEILGSPLERCSTAGLAKIGALIETPTLYAHLTGRENLRLSTLLRDLPESSIDRALAVVELTDAADRRAGQYSLGMKQRLGLANALLGEPKLLILDEPTNGLDPAGIREIRQLIAELPQESGVTVFLSSHRLDEVRQMAGRLVVLDRGRLLFQGETADFGGSSSVVVLETNDPATAIEIARGLGHRASKQEEGSVTVSGIDREAGAELVRKLAAAGVDIYRVAPQSVGLEGAFLDLTAPSPNEEAP